MLAQGRPSGSQAFFAGAEAATHVVHIQAVFDSTETAVKIAIAANAKQ